MVEAFDPLLPLQVVSERGDQSQHLEVAVMK